MVTTKINIDLAKKTTAPVVYAMQNDSDSRVVEAHLFVNGLPFDIGEASLSVLFQKPDGKGGWYDKLPDESNAIEAKDGNVVSAIIAPQVLNVAGWVIAAIRADFADGGILSTFPFKIFVEKDPAFGGVESNDYFNVSNWAEVNEEISNIKESLSNALVLNENGFFDAGEKDLRVGALEIDPGLETIGVRLDAEVPEPSEGEGRPTGALSFYDSSYDRPVILRNIADGEGDSDAVTVRQLNEAIASIPNGGGSADVSYFGVPYESAEAVYDISAAQDGSLKMYIFSNSAGFYDAVVSGTGEMVSRGENAVEYKAYVPYISRLHIEAGVTDIGSFFMYGAYNLQDLSFADSTAIARLKAYAFAKTMIDGEYDFSGLTDTEMECVFMGCARLEGLTLSATIKTIKGDEAFRNCFALRYVKGLTGLTNITGRACFYNCTSLEELEVIPDNVTLGVATFVHCPNTAVISGTTTPLYQADWGNIGSDCFVQNMWTEEQLTAIRATKGEKTNVLPVPAYDAQTDEFYGSYDLVWYVNGTKADKGAAKNSGCGFFSIYYCYNAMHPEAQFNTFRDFVEKLILPRKIKVTQDLYDALVNDSYGQRLIAANSTVSYEAGQEITAFDLPYTLSAADFTADYTALWGVLQSLGWTATKTVASDIVNGVSNMKRKLIDTLANNEPVFITIHSRRENSDGGHAVAVIGYNAEIDKFLIVDSSNVLPSQYCTVTYWVDIEALTAPFQKQVGTNEPIEITYILTFDFGEVVTMTDIDNKLDTIMQGLSFHALSGTFTPESDTNVFSVSTEAGAKMVEIVPTGTPSSATTGRFPVTHVTATEAQQKNGTKGGAYVEYKTTSSSNPLAGTAVAFDNSTGIAFTCPGSNMTFEAGMTYNWTAYYWND